MSLTTYLLRAGWNRDPRKNERRPEGRRRAAPKVESLERLCLLSTGVASTPPSYAYVSGYKYDDYNAIGKYNPGDTGLKNWVILAYVAQNHNGKLSQQEYDKGPAAYAFTNNNGYYQLELQKGYSYIIVEELKGGWYQSGPSQSVLAGHFDSLGSYGYAIKYLDKDVSNEDFYNYQLAHLSGYKYYDKNHDGKFDHGDAGLKGWEILAFVDQNHNGKLSRQEYLNGPAAYAYTNNNGYYSIDLKPGYYILVEVEQPHWYQSAPHQSVASGFVYLGQYGYAESVKSGQDYSGLNFGNYQKLT